jgi:heat shock protein HslJ
MKPSRISLVLILLSLLLSACTGSISPGGSELVGSAWVLTAIAGDPPIQGVQPKLKFEAGRVSGNASCNTFGGEYRVRGETLRFEALFWTEMACLNPEGIMEQEQTYMRLLGAAQRFELVDDRLVITTAGGERLTFERQ